MGWPDWKPVRSANFADAKKSPVQLAPGVATSNTHQLRSKSLPADVLDRFTVKKSTVELQIPDRTTIFADTEITVARCVICPSTWSSCGARFNTSKSTPRTESASYGGRVPANRFDAVLIHLSNSKPGARLCEIARYWLARSLGIAFYRSDKQCPLPLGFRRSRRCPSESYSDLANAGQP